MASPAVMIDKEEAQEVTESWKGNGQCEYCSNSLNVLCFSLMIMVKISLHFRSRVFKLSEHLTKRYFLMYIFLFSQFARLHKYCVKKEAKG